MPTYTYKCSKCESSLEIFHSMSETAEDCSVCGSKNTLVKQISTVARVTKTSSTANKKPGTLVRKYIEDVRQDIKEEKKRLKAQEYSE